VAKSDLAAACKGRGEDPSPEKGNYVRSSSGRQCQFDSGAASCGRVCSDEHRTESEAFWHARRNSRQHREGGPQSALGHLRCHPLSAAAITAIEPSCHAWITQSSEICFVAKHAESTSTERVTQSQSQERPGSFGRCASTCPDAGLMGMPTHSGK
jgi:hypothetical protein